MEHIARDEAFTLLKKYNQDHTGGNESHRR